MAASPKSIIVNGIEIKKGEKYQVVPKQPGTDSPEVYQEIGSEKSLNPGVSNGYCWVYDGSLRRWDTGFYPESPYFTRNRIQYEDATKLAKQYKDFVLGSYKTLQPSEKFEDTSEENSKFFESEEFSGRITVGRVFDTANPIHLMGLYMAILSGSLAPKGKRSVDEVRLGLGSEMDARYRGAQYSLVNNSKVLSREEEEIFEKNQAIGSFTNFLTTDKKTAVALMNYEGLRVTKDMNDMKRNTTFNKFLIEGGHLKIKGWNETVKKFVEDEKEFKNELQIIEYLRNEGGYKLLEADGDDYKFMGVKLGQKKNFKGIAKKIAETPEIQKEFIKQITSA